MTTAATISKSTNETILSGTTFEYFSKLSLELRLQIWKDAAYNEQIIHVADIWKGLLQYRRPAAAFACSESYKAITDTCDDTIYAWTPFHCHCAEDFAEVASFARSLAIGEETWQYWRREYIESEEEWWKHFPQLRELIIVSIGCDGDVDGLVQFEDTDEDGETLKRLYKWHDDMLNNTGRQIRVRLVGGVNDVKMSWHLDEVFKSSNNIL
jgi:hypothetical protein